MTKESKQLNWFLVAVVGCAFIYSCVEVVDQGTVVPKQPVQIDLSDWPAPADAVVILLDMAETCYIEPELIAAVEDEVLTNAEVLELGDLCVSRAEEEALKDNPHALDIIRNQYDNNGGLRM